jgi:glyoxylase-like metal-dependent hydrolase (beta-lactamase superfamily II)
VEVTGGHTPRHQIVWVTGKRRALVYPGDLAPTAAHLVPAAITAYDLDRTTTLERKLDLVRRVADKDVVVAWTHDPKAPAARIRTAGPMAEAVDLDPDET